MKKFIYGILSVAMASMLMMEEDPDLFAAAGRANVGFNNTLAFFAVHFSSSLCSVCISGQYFSLYSSDHIPGTA